MPRHHLARTLLVGSLAASLLVSGAGLQAQAAPKPDPRSTNWKPAKERPVRTTAIPTRTSGTDPDGRRSVTSAGAVRWPAPGVAEVAVPRPAAPRTDWSALVTGQHTPPASGAAAKAGDLPVEIGPATSVRGAAAATTPTRVRVELLGRRADELQLRVSRADGVATAGRVSVRVDYSAFAGTYGGDWASRLRLTEVPACSPRPKLPCVAKPIGTRNDGSGRLLADIAVGARPTLFAVAAAASGPAGDSTSTSLNGTATWQAGGASGDFSWNYPLKVPPSAGGPKPQVSLAYSSGSVDGRTTAANSQSSWVGAGFELTPGGAIERRYASCGVKSQQDGNNGKSPTGDLCWATDNAVFSLNGAGGELIRDDTTLTWRARSDDGMKIERKTGAINNDEGPEAGDGARGEYWVLTDKAGTRYYFGLNKLPGGTEDTNSAWTVPVFGNNPKEPCNRATFATSHCQQAYRWNLDYVVDAHGNTMRLFYDVETNHYARTATATSVSKYVRAGNIRRIEYGQREGTGPGSDRPIAQVLFSTAERCYHAIGCVAADYPDTPLDQECTSTSNCDKRFYPTFWTKKRLSKVLTQVYTDGQFQPVAAWTPRFRFLSPDDGRSPLLWLDGLTTTGLVKGEKSLPEMTFDAVLKPNRIVGVDGIPALNWPRIDTITYGSGGKVTVGYYDPDCSLPGNVPAPDTNGRRCHPIKWTPEGQAEREDWFAKYVVKSVTEFDQVSGTDPVTTQYEYPTPPAWRFDEEDGLVEVGRKTWSQWRGYEQVKSTKGNDATPKTVTLSRYFRGMDGDKLLNGGTKSVVVTDSAGGTWPDSNPLSGMLRERVTYSAGKIADRSITDPWQSAATATRVREWGTTKAFQVHEQGVREAHAVGAGWRTSSTRNEYAADGKLIWSSDKADDASSTDDTCTRYEYFANPDRGLTDLPARKQVVDVSCDKAWTQQDVIADERTTFDAGTGDALSSRRLAGFGADGTEIYETVATTGYDAYGRPVKALDAKGKETRIEYLPATGALTQTRTTQPTGLTTASVVDPATGEEVAVVDQGGRRTDTVRDPLGRVVASYLPGRSRSEPPNARYEYSDNPAKPAVTKVTTLQADGSFSESYELADGLGRKRQSHKPSADGYGWVVTDYLYDSRGLQTEELGPYHVETRPADGSALSPVSLAEVPSRKVIEYDDLGRPSTERTYIAGRLQSTTTHTNATGAETIDPPDGEQATTRITDVKGRLVEFRQYRTAGPSTEFDSTKYTYHPSGQPATVTDAAGNVWRYEYDLRGRKIREVDPNRGATTFGYDERDRLVSVTDARKVTLTYTYDDGGRRTGSYLGPVADENRLASWTYDTVKPGSLSSATRYVNGAEYTLRFTGYTDAGKPTGTELVVPPTEGGLQGVHRIDTTFTADGQPATTKFPAVGGLPEETLTFGYSPQNRPTTLTGSDSYVIDTQYTPYGETSSLALAKGANWLEQQYDYELGTRRLTRAGVVTPNGVVSDVGYSYDDAGNVTRISDAADRSSAGAADTQCFRYDQYRRMTAAWTPAGGDCAATPTTAGLGGPAPYWHSWTFDALGNRKSEVRNTAAGATTSTYTYAPTKPHQTQQVATSGPGVNRTDQYQYDEIGSQKAAPGQTLTWDAEGRLGEVVANGKTTSYLYDADGNRLIRRDATGTTLYLGQTELLLKPDGSLVGTRYYSFGDHTIAVRVGNKLTWAVTDHHGTVNLTVDPQTLAVQRRRTTPYGETRGAVPAQWPGQRGFVGGTEDQTGLIHLGAREYNPALGKFVSVDPVVDPNEPQQLNAYAYANNNPASFSDADGKRWVVDTVTQLKTVIRVVTKRIVEYKKEVVRLSWAGAIAAQMAAEVARLGPAGHAFLARIRGHQSDIQYRIKRIVRIVHELVKEMIRVTRKIQRWDPMGDTGLSQLLREATDVWRLAEAAQQAAHAPAPPVELGKKLNEWLRSDVGTYLFGGDDPFSVRKNGPRDRNWDEVLFFGGVLGGVGGALGGVGGAVVGAGIPLAGAAAWNDVHDKNGYARWHKAVPWLAPLPAFAGMKAGQFLSREINRPRWWQDERVRTQLFGK